MGYLDTIYPAAAFIHGDAMRVAKDKRKKHLWEQPLTQRMEGTPRKNNQGVGGADIARAKHFTGLATQHERWEIQPNEVVLDHRTRKAMEDSSNMHTKLNNTCLMVAIVR